jgi:septum formation topological specificity factor MinE
MLRGRMNVIFSKYGRMEVLRSEILKVVTKKIAVF